MAGGAISRRLIVAATWSLGAHLVVFGALTRFADGVERRAEARVARRVVEFEAKAAQAAPAPVGEAAPPVQLGKPPEVMWGPGDVVARAEVSPWPEADVDAPDPRAAGQAGGDSGGPAAYSGRHDKDDVRAQAWNDPRDYRLPRHGDDDRRVSPESVARLPDPGVDAAERDRAPTVREAEPAPAARAQGVPETPMDDPMFAGPAVGAREPVVAPPSAAARDGQRKPGKARPDVVDGQAANEADRHGARADDAEAAQASNERSPGPLEFTKPASGGEGTRGVAGPQAGAGSSADARRVGDGLGGTPADVVAGPGTPSTKARPQNPYWHELRKRIRAHMVYPRELVVSIEQGEVLVGFTLHGDGSVSDVQVERSSGYAQLDAAAVAAVQQAAPFGKVPDELLRGRKSFRVPVPLTFANPIIP